MVRSQQSQFYLLRFLLHLHLSYYRILDLLLDSQYHTYYTQPKTILTLYKWLASQLERLVIYQYLFIYLIILSVLIGGLFVLAELVVYNFPNNMFSKWWRKYVVFECQDCD